MCKYKLLQPLYSGLGVNIMDENIILQTNNTLLNVEDINLQYSISFKNLTVKTEPFNPVKFKVLFVQFVLCYANKKGKVLHRAATQQRL